VVAVLPCHLPMAARQSERVSLCDFAVRPPWRRAGSSYSTDCRHDRESPMRLVRARHGVLLAQAKDDPTTQSRRAPRGCAIVLAPNAVPKPELGRRQNRFSSRLRRTNSQALMSVAGHQRRFDVGGMSAIAPIATKNVASRRTSKGAIMRHRRQAHNAKSSSKACPYIKSSVSKPSVNRL
jgi:hypothetical protein